jgi:uncharacterized protein (TIGR00730 family)
MSDPFPELPPEAAENLQRIFESPSYVLAEQDVQFLARPELRPVRLQLELLKPEMSMVEHKIVSTVVVFGGTRIAEKAQAEQRLVLARRKLATEPDNKRVQREVSRCERLLAKSHFYDHARRFAQLVSEYGQSTEILDFVVTTGGGPGIMEAANRGALDVAAKSMGLNITLPAEQRPNAYITPELCFQFHYFALRKMHFVMRAAALVAFPGGFGTLDEFFDSLTLRQTRRMQEIPIILYGSEYWNQVFNLHFLADEGVIEDEHLDLIQFADTPEQALQIIIDFYAHRPPAPEESPEADTHERAT